MSPGIVHRSSPTPRRSSIIKWDNLRFFYGAFSRTKQEEVARWERIRETGPLRFALIGGAVGAGFASLFVGPDFLLDLIDLSFSPILYYLTPLCLLGLICALGALALYGTRNLWYRWETTGKKPLWKLRYEANQRVAEDRIFEEGPTRYVLVGSISGGLVFALLTHVSLHPLGIPASPVEFLKSFLYGAIIGAIGSGMYVAGTLDKRRRDIESRAGNTQQGP